MIETVPCSNVVEEAGGYFCTCTFNLRHLRARELAQSNEEIHQERRLVLNSYVLVCVISTSRCSSAT